MTAKIVLTAADGSSMTPAIDILRHEFPDIYQQLEAKISAEEKPTTFGGTGAVDLAKVAIEINVSPEVMKQLKPFFKLLVDIMKKYTKKNITASIIIEQNGEVVEWSLEPEE